MFPHLFNKKPFLSLLRRLYLVDCIIKIVVSSNNDHSTLAIFRDLAVLAHLVFEFFACALFCDTVKFFLLIQKY